MQCLELMPEHSWLTDRFSCSCILLVHFLLHFSAEPCTRELSTGQLRNFTWKTEEGFSACTEHRAFLALCYMHAWMPLSTMGPVLPRPSKVMRQNLAWEGVMAFPSRVQLPKCTTEQSKPGKEGSWAGPMAWCSSNPSCPAAGEK